MPDYLLTIHLYHLAGVGRETGYINAVLWSLTQNLDPKYFAGTSFMTIFLENSKGSRGSASFAGGNYKGRGLMVQGQVHFGSFFSISLTSIS